MANDERILRQAAADAAVALASGESPARWDQPVAESAETGLLVGLSRLEAGTSEPRVVLNLRVDRDILDFFRSAGPGHRQRFHAVLRAYVDRMRKP